MACIRVKEGESESFSIYGCVRKGVTYPFGCSMYTYGRNNNIYLFIYLLCKYLNPATAGLALMNAKKKDKKERKVRGVKKMKEQWNEGNK